MDDTFEQELTQWIMHGYRNVHNRLIKVSRNFTINHMVNWNLYNGFYLMNRNLYNGSYLVNRNLYNGLYMVDRNLDTGSYLENKTMNNGSYTVTRK